MVSGIGIYAAYAGSPEGLRAQDVLCLRARAFLRHISLSLIGVARQPVDAGYRALDPAGFMVLSEVETSLALIMGLESSSIPL